jgi:N-glycosylase/DNA lyase
MTTLTLYIPTADRFGFWQTVNSHGWCALPPFGVDRKVRKLTRLLELRDGTLVKCTLGYGDKQINVALESRPRLARQHKEEIARHLRECLRLQEDFSDFYAQARRIPEYRWIARQGAGRLLRAPTVFEDVVKMICTTNCSWALTESMVGNLTRKLGKPFGDGLHAFPTPEAMAGVSEQFLRTEVRTGYRSPYLLELATRIAEGELDIEKWRNSSLPSEELFEEVRSIKGMGVYAAGNILKLLGRYDYLGLDSWVRSKYYEVHRKGRKVGDATIEKHYAQLGAWRGLFFWLEMTRDWYEQKFPF